MSGAIADVLGQRECYVYRHYDVDGMLLYVGITYNLAGRTEQHRRSQPWAGQIDRIEHDLVPDRATAEQIERWLVAFAKPKYNKVLTSFASKAKAAKLKVPDELVAEAKRVRLQILRSHLRSQRKCREGRVLSASEIGGRRYQADRYLAYANHDRGRLAGLIRDDALWVTCPKCSRDPGYACRSLGNGKTSPHSARRKYATALARDWIDPIDRMLIVARNDYRLMNRILASGRRAA